MTTYNYISLLNSNGSFEGRFRVLMGSLHTIFRKVQTRRRTLTGRIDNQEGAVYRAWTMVLRVHAEEPDGSPYGTLGHLQAFYSSNNPVGTPSNVIRFTDHLGVQRTVNIIGDLDEENLIPMLDGPEAAFLVPLQMEETL